MEPISNCPVCNSSDLSWENFELNDDMVFQRGYCNLCNCSWTEQYKYDGLYLDENKFTFMEHQGDLNGETIIKCSECGLTFQLEGELIEQGEWKFKDRIASARCLCPRCNNYLYYDVGWEW